MGVGKERKIMSKSLYVLEKAIKYFSYIFCLTTVILIIVAMFFSPASGEATVGNLSSTPYNKGWTATVNGKETEITLPTRLDCGKGDTIVIKNTLPSGVKDGSTLMFRTTMQSVYIYIGGVLRTSYASENLEGVGEYLPSEYVVATLLERDANKEVEIRIRVMDAPIINSISINDGNNGWFAVVGENLPLFIIALFVITIGISVITLYGVFHKKVGVSKSVNYLGILMIMVGLYIVSESKLRQLVFSRPSLSSYFSFMLLEILGVFVTKYTDEVQKQRYHRSYTIIQAMICSQIIVNMALHILGIAELYSTLIFSHFWVIVGLVVIIIILMLDIRGKYIKEYKIVAYGMAQFVLMCGIELLNFYFNSQNPFGLFLCLGLVILMLATIVQAVFDAAKKDAEQDRERQNAWIGTIETIASAIDAKDEYTGGHSIRVGEYVGILAREMASEYEFSEDDLIRIQYIGLLHDIGKIGVADNVLNKVGRLTDEEFTLMKKHVEIGFDLLYSIGKSTEGLLDGIRYHHERYDGKGYPEGLEGESIPLIARMLCIADCYDAMTSNRVYRNRLTDREVRNEIAKCAGRQFDPKITEIFVRLLDDGKIKPATVEGLAAFEDGRILASAQLEQMLKTDISENRLAVINPPHVRMVCYIIKLAEENNKNFALFRIELRNDSASKPSQETEQQHFEENVKLHMQTRDVCVAYTPTIYIVALFDRAITEIEEFTSSFAENVNVIPIK